MLVSGPIGAIATGSGCSAQDPGDERDGALGAGRAPAPASRTVVPIPLSPWTSVARTTEPSSAPGRALGDRDVVAAVGVEQPQRVLGAVA